MTKKRQGIRIYKTKPATASGYKPYDVARNSRQAREIVKGYRASDQYSGAVIVKTGRQGKVRSGPYKGESRLTYTIYVKPKKRR